MGVALARVCGAASVIGLVEDAGEDGGEDLTASPATHQLRPAFRIGMVSGGDKMKEPTFRIPVLGIQHGHMLSEFQRTWGEKKDCYFRMGEFHSTCG